MEEDLGHFKHCRPYAPNPFSLKGTNVHFVSLEKCKPYQLDIVMFPLLKKKIKCIREGVTGRNLRREGGRKWLNDYDDKFKKMFGELKLFELRTANKVLRDTAV